MANKLTGALDTNTLLRLILGDVPEQAQRVKKLLTECNRVDVTDAVLFEMVYVMEKLYKIDRDQIAENIRVVIRSSKINSNRLLFERTLPDYVQFPKLSIIDCAAVHYARLNNATPLYTFDKDLAKSLTDTELLS